jgi:hypothetical protein
MVVLVATKPNLQVVVWLCGCDCDSMSVVWKSISVFGKASINVVHTLAPSVYTRSGLIILHFLDMDMGLLSLQQVAAMTQEELAAVLYNNCCHQVDGCDTASCLVGSKMLRFFVGMVGEQSMTS